MPRVQSFSDFIVTLEAEVSGERAEGLKPAYRRIDPEVRALEEENERLKRIIARQAASFL